MNYFDRGQIPDPRDVSNAAYPPLHFPYGRAENRFTGWEYADSQHALEAALIEAHGSGGGGGGTATSDAPGSGAEPFVSPASGGGGTDLYTASAPYLTTRPLPGFNYIRFWRPRRRLPVMAFELALHDLSGGLDLEEVEISQLSPVPNKLADSTLDHRHARTLCLLPKEDFRTQSPAQESAILSGEQNLSTAYLRADSSAAWMGAGNRIVQGGFEGGGDMAVFPAVEIGGSTVISLSTVIIGGTGVERLVVGLRTSAPFVLSSALTNDGFMHANLNPCWGAFVSPLNAQTPGAGTILFYANRGIWALSTNAAIGAAPVQLLSDVPNGGYIIGNVQLPGQRHGLYMCWPKKTLSDSVLDTAITVPMDIVSVNLEGTDNQAMVTGLDYVTHAVKWRNSLAYTDGQRVIWHDGRIKDLHWARERRWGSDGQGQVTALFPIGHDRLLAAVTVTNGAGEAMSSWLEEYIPEANQGFGGWYRATKPVSHAGFTHIPFLRTAGVAPVLHHNTANLSTRAHRLYWYRPWFTGSNSAEGWYSISLLPLAINPFYWQNHQGEVVREFEASGTATTPVYRFLTGYPKVIGEIVFGGTLEGTDSRVEIEIASQGRTLAAGNRWTFQQRDDWKFHRLQLPDNQEVFDRMQIHIHGYQGTDSTRRTPNFLPIILRGYVFLDFEVRRPQEIEPRYYA